MLFLKSLLKTPFLQKTDNWKLVRRLSEWPLTFILFSLISKCSNPYLLGLIYILKNGDKCFTFSLTICCRFKFQTILLEISNLCISFWGGGRKVSHFPTFYIVYLLEKCQMQNVKRKDVRESFEIKLSKKWDIFDQNKIFLLKMFCGFFSHACRLLAQE